MKNIYDVYIIDYILSDNQQLPTPTTTYKVDIYILGILIVAYHENQIDFSILCTSKYPHEWQVYLTPELFLNRLVGCDVRLWIFSGSESNFDTTSWVKFLMLKSG